MKLKGFRVKPESNKTPAREFALKFLFQLYLKDNINFKNQFYNNELKDEQFEERLTFFKESYQTPDDEHPESNISEQHYIFARRILHSLRKNIKANEELIKKELKREGLESLEKLERSILIVGVEEILQFGTPYQVVINELVELAKKYGGEQSGRFVNGVLDGIRTKNK